MDIEFVNKLIARLEARSRAMLELPEDTYVSAPMGEWSQTINVCGTVGCICGEANLLRGVREHESLGKRDEELRELLGLNKYNPSRLGADYWLFFPSDWPEQWQKEYNQLPFEKTPSRAHKEYALMAELLRWWRDEYVYQDLQATRAWEKQLSQTRAEITRLQEKLATLENMNRD